MDEFLLPADGSVLIIDDNKDDAWPLIESLSKKGVATTYFSGTRDDEYPDRPLQKVRLAFVDIQLSPSLSSHNYAQTIKSILNRLISDKNGPYIVVLWSQKEELHAKTVEEELTSNFEKRPIIVLRLEKHKFFKRDFENSLRKNLSEDISKNLKNQFREKQLKSIKKVIDESFSRYLPVKKEIKQNASDLILSELATKLDKANTFHLLIMWENLINRASGRIVNSFSSLHKVGKNWDNNLKYSIYRMAHAQLGMTVDSVNGKDLISSALKTMNSTLLDEIENKITKVSDLSSIVKINKDKISFLKIIETKKYEIRLVTKTEKYRLYIDNIRIPKGQKIDKKLSDLYKNGSSAKEKDEIAGLVHEISSVTPEINTKLLLNFSGSTSESPGTVFLKKPRIKIKKATLNDSFQRFLNFKTEKKENDQKQLIITKNELKKILFVELEVSPPCDYAQKKRRRLRLLPGVLIPDAFYKESFGVPESIYNMIPKIKIDNKLYKIVFDYRYLYSVDAKAKSYNGKKKSFFKLRKGVLTDISSRLSSHASRVGISIVE